MGISDAEEVLGGGRVTPGVVRIGETVRRRMLANAEFKHGLLRFLASKGFMGSPEFLGVDEQGREMLRFIPGDVPNDLAHFEDAQLRSAAQLLRAFHDASSNFAAVKEAGMEVACHNDWTPCNTVFVAGTPVAMIDFDTAAPGMRLWDMGYSAFTWLDLGNTDYTGAEQIRRLTMFTEAYAHPECRPAAVAVHAVARMTSLATAARGKGDAAMAAWADAAAAWSAAHVLEAMLPTGQFAAAARQD